MVLEQEQDSIDHITTSTLNMSSNKTPPLLSAAKDYFSWKKSIKIWSEFTSLEPKKQGAAVCLTLDGTVHDSALELDESKISSDTGLVTILKQLDELYLKDETLQKYEVLDELDNYRRSPDIPINEFLHKFSMLYNKLNSYGTTISDNLLGYKLLKAANLSVDHEKLAKATCALKYDVMREQLRKIFSDSASTLASSSSSLNVNEVSHVEPAIEQTSRVIQLLSKVSKQLPSAQSNITLHLSKDCQGQPKNVIANKIHHQFARAPADNLIRLLNNAGLYLGAKIKNLRIN